MRLAQGGIPLLCHLLWWTHVSSPHALTAVRTVTELASQGKKYGGRWTVACAVAPPPRFRFYVFTLLRYNFILLFRICHYNMKNFILY